MNLPQSLQLSSNALSRATVTTPFSTAPVYFNATPSAQTVTSMTPLVAVLALVGILIARGKL